MLSDDALIALWIHGRPETTKRAYRADIAKLLYTLGAKSLAEATLEDLQRHTERLAGLSPRSQARAVAAIRSLFSFHTRVGTLATDPSAALIGPRVPQDLAERILTVAEVERLIGAAPPGAQRAMLSLLYLGGLRAGELCSLYWRQVQARTEGEGQVTVHGKGGKTRTVLLPPEMFGALVDLKVNPRLSDPVFPAALDRAKPIGQRQLLDIVKRAARTAGLADNVSMHWLRHSHASHALDAGAPITLVRDTLGHASIATTNRYAHARPNEGSARYLTRKPPT